MEVTNKDFGELKFIDVVYDLGALNHTHPYIWCEHLARFHTLFEIRCQVKAYKAIPTIYNERPFNKGNKLAESSWRTKTQHARDEIANKLKLETRLDKSNIVWEHAISVDIPIIDLEF